jgi:hypothetical protein
VEAMGTMGWDSSHHENDSTPAPHRGSVPSQWRGVVASVTIRLVDTKTRLVVALVFLLAISLIVIAGLIAVASPAK